VQQVQKAIARGKLAVGEQLPPVRALAERLVVNPNTVAKAYQELIASGLLESQAGRGVFVSEKRRVFSKAEEERRLRTAAEQLVHEAHLFERDLPGLQKLLRAAWDDLQARSEKT